MNYTATPQCGTEYHLLAQIKEDAEIVCILLLCRLCLKSDLRSLQFLLRNEVEVSPMPYLSSFRIHLLVFVHVVFLIFREITVTNGQVGRTRRLHHIITDNYNLEYYVKVIIYFFSVDTVAESCQNNANHAASRKRFWNSTYTQLFYARTLQTIQGLRSYVWSPQSPTKPLENVDLVEFTKSIHVHQKTSKTASSKISSSLLNETAELCVTLKQKPEMPQ